MTILEEAAAISGDITELRHAIHREPEIGACPPGTDARTAPSNHSAAALFDDAVLADGTALYAELALRRLGGSR